MATDIAEDSTDVGESHDDEKLEVSFLMSPEGVSHLQELARASGESLDNVISKAFILYRLAREANRQGKAVGVAATPDVLETEFVGF